MLKGLIQVPVVCTVCKTESSQFTYEKYLKKKKTPIAKMMDKDGYVSIVCDKCKKEEEKSPNERLH